MGSRLLCCVALCLLGSDNAHLNLHVKSLEPEDSALYLCASSQDTALQNHQLPVHKPARQPGSCGDNEFPGPEALLSIPVGPVECQCAAASRAPGGQLSSPTQSPAESLWSAEQGLH
ncbi:Hypothetical predicted protein [Marmota monax]|uniref:Immunoglobulin V-set domain-containing protein n=1 Tax=Marmota monax TaxID=9995 RepID=A0A5E4AS77_MARMO|nr:hypothetical protein GHT09_000239 [Marmota monax]VTJ59509.1 Hypothetical predicted protein [Marmota monax]